MIETTLAAYAASDVSDAGTSKPERVSLSRDLSEFLAELSVALHKHAMYPSGHPSLGPAAAGVAGRAARLLESRETLAFGVARRQLIIEGVATDPNHPVLRRLAEGLHGHHLGAVSLTRGVEAAEIGAALRALATEVEREGPLGLAPTGHILSWPHVRLHPLTFDRLQLAGDAPLTTGGPGGPSGWKGAEMWIGLARAAMANDAPDQSVEADSTEPSLVAQAIDKHQGAAAYDQVVVGYLLQIANELKTATGAEAAALRRRTGRLISSLRPETLRRLIEMGGDVAQRRAFVLNATSGMAVEAVIDILKAAADTSGQTISHGLIRMLSKLAAHTEIGDEQSRSRADGALREQVSSLLSDWNLADPNPEAYGQVLQHLATTAPAGRRLDGGGDQADQSDPLRVVQMSLEVGAGGPLVDRAVDRAIDGGAVGSLLKLLETAPGQSDAGESTVRRKLLLPSTIHRLITREPVELDALDQLLPLLSTEGYDVLLDALATSGNRATRRRLLDRLPRTDLDVGPLIVARLTDDRWFVQRNMLLLLERSGRVPAGFSVTPWTRHPDARVRYEAIRLQLRLPAERHVALLASLHDLDLRIMRLGLAALQDECPPAIAGIVVRVALNSRIIEELRLLAVGALARSRERVSLDALLRLVDGGRTLLGRTKLAPRTPVVIAAVRALAGAWASDTRAAGMLALAVGSSDPEVRQAARQTRP